MKDTNLLTNNGVNLQASLELFGDMEIYEETLQDFLDGVGHKVDSIKRFKENGDMANYAILVHSLKSDARYLGFTKLAELAYDHELQSKANNLYNVTDHFDELMQETQRIVALVKQYMNGETAQVQTPAENIAAPVVEDNKKTILVVDDSTIIRNFIEKIFNETFKVVNAGDGGEAIDIINQGNEEIVGVLLDLNMPNVDGFAVLDYFKEHGLFTKFAVSIITGEDTKDAITRAFSYPIVDVVNKPFNERDIKRIVEKTIEYMNNK